MPNEESDMRDGSWICLHEGPKHLADVERIETTRDGSGTEIAISHCRKCGGFYRWYRFEINDWSGGNDYSDETEVWQVLAGDEMELVRSDDNYQPRDGREHRSDKGWRRDGGVEPKPSVGERLRRLARKAFWD